MKECKRTSIDRKWLGVKDSPVTEDTVHTEDDTLCVEYFVL